MNAVQQAVNDVGGLTIAAGICGVSPTAIYKWVKRGSLPRTEYTGETCYSKLLAGAAGGKFSHDWLLSSAKPKVN